MSKIQTRSILFFCLALVFLLSSCQTLRADRREVEQLHIMQTLGLDAAPGGVLVTLASAAGNGEEAVCISGVGPSLSAAIENARLNATNEELFTGHLQYILIGEEAARQGIDRCLAYICRSGDLRLDMPVFILRETQARAAMEGAGGDGITSQLQAVVSRLENRGDSRAFSAARILRGLEGHGSALACALRCAPSSQAGSSSGEENGGKDLSVSADGFAVLQDSKLQEWISAWSAPGVGLLINESGICELEVRDRFGSPVTLEIQDGSTRLHPLWAKDGSLRGVEIYTRVSASVLEADAGADFSSEIYTDYLTGQLETAISDRISQVLRLARGLETDLTGLGDRLEQTAPMAYRRAGTDLGQCLADLELSIAVQGELRHSNDMS